MACRHGGLLHSVPGTTHVSSLPPSPSPAPTHLIASKDHAPRTPPQRQLRTPAWAFSSSLPRPPYVPPFLPQAQGQVQRRCPRSGGTKPYASCRHPCGTHTWHPATTLSHGPAAFGVGLPYGYPRSTRPPPVTLSCSAPSPTLSPLFPSSSLPTPSDPDALPSLLASVPPPAGPTLSTPPPGPGLPQGAPLPRRWGRPRRRTRKKDKNPEAESDSVGILPNPLAGVPEAGANPVSEEAAKTLTEGVAKSLSEREGGGWTAEFGEIVREAEDPREAMGGVLRAIGLSEAEAEATLVRGSPFAASLTWDSLHSALDVFRLLHEVGFSREDVHRLVLRHPRAAFWGRSAAEAKILGYREFGVPARKLPGVMVELFDLSLTGLGCKVAYLRELGVRDVGKMMVTHPRMMRSSLAFFMLLVTRLESVLGRPGCVDALERAPGILRMSEATLGSTIRLLEELVGKDKVADVIRSCPRVLLHNPENIVPVVSYLERHFGLRPIEVLPSYIWTRSTRMLLKRLSHLKNQGYVIVAGKEEKKEAGGGKSCVCLSAIGQRTLQFNSQFPGYEGDLDLDLKAAVEGVAEKKTGVTNDDDV